MGEVLKLRERRSGLWLRVENKRWIKLVVCNGIVKNELTSKQLNFIEAYV